MTKRLILGGALLLALASCGKNSSDYKELKAQYDSLAVVNQNYEAELHETDSLVASVLTNFQEITSVEGMINVNPMNGDIKRTEQERIKDNMLLINDKLRARSLRLVVRRTNVLVTPSLYYVRSWRLRRNVY